MTPGSTYKLRSKKIHITLWDFIDERFEWGGVIDNYTYSYYNGQVSKINWFIVTGNSINQYWFEIYLPDINQVKWISESDFKDYKVKQIS